MKNFLRATLNSYGFIPILFASLIFINYMFGFNYMFKGQSALPNPYFALALFVFGIFWTIRFQKRAE